MNPQIQNVFRKRKITYTIVFVVILGVYFFASAITQFHLQEGLAAFPKAFLWIGQNLIPDALAIRRFPKIMDKLIETALLSVAVTVIAAVFAFALSLFGSESTGRSCIMKRIVRIIAAFFRNVPDVVWAMLLMFSFGQNILTGFFALFFTTFGMLTRAFIETIDIRCELHPDRIPGRDSIGHSRHCHLGAVHDRNQYPQFYAHRHSDCHRNRLSV